MGVTHKAAQPVKTTHLAGCLMWPFGAWSLVVTATVLGFCHQTLLLLLLLGVATGAAVVLLGLSPVTLSGWAV